ncbi:MAG: type II toxin-antitoxin system RelE/ParE family toxin [Planctomycetaceae bacterium]|nr:type II toxin-antitoxin system RelE/ParE family toxin [Planctomycetaceae bacterium]
MNSPLIIRPEAEQDLAEARDWYEAQRDELGDDFLAAIDPVFDQIRASPE